MAKIYGTSERMTGSYIRILGWEPIENVTYQD